jgi:hypothetical protein
MRGASLSRIGIIVLAAAAALPVACSASNGDSSTASPAGIDASAPAGDDCAALSEADGFTCAEASFWSALRVSSLEARARAENALVTVIARSPAPRDARAASTLHFRLGQLRMAMALENGKQDYFLKSKDLIVGEFDKAMALDVHDGVIATFEDTMKMAIAAVLGDWGAAVDLANQSFEHIAQNPMGNTLSLSGTAMGYPMSTGVPTRMIPYLDAWKCSGVAWCTENTSHAPFARPGLAYHFAEAYARVGDRAKAADYLAKALAAPDADRWPYRDIAARAAADVDALVKSFSDLGPDGSAMNVVYANKPYGCLFCHGAPVER